MGSHLLQCCAEMFAYQTAVRWMRRSLAVCRESTVPLAGN